MYPMRSADMQGSDRQILSRLGCRRKSQACTEKNLLHSFSVKDKIEVMELLSLFVTYAVDFEKY